MHQKVKAQSNFRSFDRSIFDLEQGSPAFSTSGPIEVSKIFTVQFWPRTYRDHTMRALFYKYKYLNVINPLDTKTTGTSKI